MIRHTVEAPISNPPASERIHLLEAQLEGLKRIGIMLSAEKDTMKLISLILESCMELTGSDAGSIYIKETAQASSRLRFMHSLNHSRDFCFEEHHLPIDKNSIAGYCAYTAMPYIFNDIEDVSLQMFIRYNDYFDHQIDYHTKNMVVVPMMDIHNEVLGVVQLINKKKDYHQRLAGEGDYLRQIIPYQLDEAELIMAIASQAAMLIERSKLLQSIETLFNNFVESMVLTIDKRDPTTSGHSLRVAKLVKALAEAVDRSTDALSDAIHFSQDQIKEIYYASLLHDIGKIGISEAILCKKAKLDSDRLELIRYRFLYFKKELELRKNRGLLNTSEQAMMSRLDDDYEFIFRINHSGFLTDQDEHRLREIGSQHLTDLNGDEMKLLKSDELENLLVKHGNLNASERNLMNLHAEHTYDILKDIPWPTSLQRIPQISAAHHEKLDGSGYPHHLKRDEILFETKMIAIADIFEALTAKDRPYREGMSLETALDILRQQADENHLDKHLVDLFIRDALPRLREEGVL